MKKVILIGAGGRGITYTDWMQKMGDKFEVIAVAEPKKERREYIKEKHNIPEEMCFETWQPLLDMGKIADLAVIATMDRDHFEPAMKAIDLKYDLLLEKPIAPTPEECVAIEKNAKKNGVDVIICTVLRYTPVFSKLKEMIDDGKLGRVMSINHEECVGNLHQSHSFVRGNWGNSERSSVMLLQKSCHDIDILSWLLGKKCKKVQSFGTTSYFKRENAPKDAPDYCIEGCPNGEKCWYNAVKLYLEDTENYWFREAATHLIKPSDDEVKKVLRETQYGKCVFKCDNDVVDHQTVNMIFEDDITVTFTMNAFNRGGRFIHIMGTKGEVHASLGDDTFIKFYDFDTKETIDIPADGKDGILGGHGGGDEGIIRALYEYLNGNHSLKSIPDISESTENHLVTFAAEKARLDGTIVDVDEYIKEIRAKA